MKQVPCAVCGKTLKVHDNARTDRACSLLCRLIAGGELPADAADRLPWKACAVCGVEVQMNRNLTQPKYCGRTCLRVAMWNRKAGRPEYEIPQGGTCKVCGKDTRIATRKGPSPKYCGAHNPIAVRRTIGFWLPPYGLSTCVWCGDWFGKEKPDQSACGGKCTRRLYASMRLKGMPPEQERQCVVCGDSFATRIKKRRYCGKAVCKSRGRPWTPNGMLSSHAARSRYAQLRRAAVEAGDRTLTTLTIYDKAGGVCAACGIDTLHPQTPRAQRPKERYNWATLDHIVPLSQGGSHTWDNAQLLCLSCNSRKSHTDRKALQSVPS